MLAVVIINEIIFFHSKNIFLNSARRCILNYETIKVNVNGQTIENDAFDETKKWASNLIDQITRSDNPSTVTLVQVSFYDSMSLLTYFG